MGEPGRSEPVAVPGSPPRSRTIGQRAAVFVASGFGSGLIPFAPGTWGTGAAAVLVLLLARTGLHAQATLIALAVVASLLCIVLGRTVEAAVGRKDPQLFVLDEFAGFFVALALPGAAWPNDRELLAAFLLFRLFDIIKPPPARKLQSLSGGVGIVVDDLIAGLYALCGVILVRQLT